MFDALASHAILLKAFRAGEPRRLFGEGATPGVDGNYGMIRMLFDR